MVMLPRAERRNDADRLLDEFEMRIEDACFSVIETVRAYGYSERVAWATAGAMRDGALEAIEAEERRLHRIAVREAQAEIARQRWEERRHA